MSANPGMIRFGIAFARQTQLAACRLIEFKDQVHESCFASSRVSHQSNRLLLIQCKTYIPQNRGAILIGKADMLKLNFRLFDEPCSLFSLKDFIARKLYYFKKCFGICPSTLNLL